MKTAIGLIGASMLFAAPLQAATSGNTLPPADPAAENMAMPADPMLDANAADPMATAVPVTTTAVDPAGETEDEGGSRGFPWGLLGLVGLIGLLGRNR